LLFDGRHPDGSHQSSHFHRGDIKRHAARRNANRSGSPTVYDLEPGARIRIKRTFRDFDGAGHAAGRELRLVQHDVFPYQEGHTLKFDDGTVVRLSCDDPDNTLIMDNAGDTYWEALSDQ
jgi:hypothetical protein